MEKLVITALEERGIDCKVWPHAACGKSTCHGYSMLFGYSDIEELFWQLVLEFCQFAAYRHRRGQCYDASVLFGILQHCIRHEFTPRRGRLAAKHFTGIDLIWSEAMPFAELIHFGRVISFPLFSNYMHYNGAIVILGGFDCLCKIIKVMTIKRADVLYAEVFEKSTVDIEIYTVDHEIFHAVLDPVGHIPEFRSDLREAVDEIFNIMFHTVILRICAHPAQHIMHSAHIRCYAHLIIIEYDGHVCPVGTDVIQRLKGHTACQSAITDYRDDMMGSPLDIPGFRHTHCC